MCRALLICTLFLCLTSMLFAQGEYVIDRFHADVTILQDATIKVREEITATFKVRRRGIYRTIPIVVQLEGGRERGIHIYDIRVVDPSGNAYTTKVTREGDDLKIRIGDEDVFFPRGTTKTYHIEYEVYGALNWFDDEGWDERAELYWNVTGTAWGSSIGEASFSISFPKVSATDQLRARVFVGAYGSRRSVTQQGLGSTGSQGTGIKATVTDSSVTGSSTTELAAYAGLTAIISLPADVVPRPTQLEEFLRRLKEYLAFFTPVMVALCLLPFWFKSGRDKKDGPPTVQFEPPDGLPAALAGTMIDERVDQRDMAAGIMALAVKGYLTVEPKEEGTMFKRQEVDLRLTDKTETEGLSKFEAKLYKYLKKGGKLITKADIREHVGPNVLTLKNVLYDDLVDRGFYKSNPNTLRGAWIFGGIVLSAAVAFMLGSFSLIHEVWIMVVGGALGIVPAAWLGWHMPRRTLRGAEVRRELLGFFEMMRHRENYMRWVVKTQPDGLKYEEYLPYAVAFDLIEEWNDAFKDIMTEPPSWYHDRYATGFVMMNFTHTLSHITSDLSASAGTPPRSSGGAGGSSGFGGGGFSGGGFGGGGGGSW